MGGERKNLPLEIRGGIDMRTYREYPNRSTNFKKLCNGKTPFLGRRGSSRKAEFESWRREQKEAKKQNQKREILSPLQFIKRLMPRKAL